MEKKRPFTKIVICTNWRAGGILSSCGENGSKEFAAAIEKGLKDRCLPFEFQALHCMGKCHLGPTMRLIPAGPFIMGAKEDDAAHILDLLADGKFDQLADEFPLTEQVF